MEDFVQAILDANTYQAVEAAVPNLDDPVVLKELALSFHENKLQEAQAAVESAKNTKEIAKINNVIAKLKNSKKGSVEIGGDEVAEFMEFAIANFIEKFDPIVQEGTLNQLNGKLNGYLYGLSKEDSKTEKGCYIVAIIAGVAGFCFGNEQFSLKEVTDDQFQSHIDALDELAALEDDAVVDTDMPDEYVLKRIISLRIKLQDQMVNNEEEGLDLVNEVKSLNVGREPYDKIKQIEAAVKVALNDFSKILQQYLNAADDTNLTLIYKIQLMGEVFDDLSQLEDKVIRTKKNPSVEGVALLVKTIRNIIYSHDFLQDTRSLKHKVSNFFRATDPKTASGIMNELIRAVDAQVPYKKKEPDKTQRHNVVTGNNNSDSFSGKRQDTTATNTSPAESIQHRKRDGS
jgi:hypothetical protein